MKNREIFAARLKHTRLKTGKTQKQFADMVSSTAATISAYENMAKNPSLENVVNIAEKCNVSIDWLCGLTEKESLSTAPKTYSDIILELLEIDKILHISIEEVELPVNGRVYPNIGYGIHIGGNMDKYLSDLAKYKNIKSEGLIDEDIYQACICKLLEKSNHEIVSDKKSDGSSPAE